MLFPSLGGYRKMLFPSLGGYTRMLKNTEAII